MAETWKVGDVAVINCHYPVPEYRGKAAVVTQVGESPEGWARVLTPDDGETWIVYPRELDRP